MATKVKRVLIMPSGTEIALEAYEALSRRRDIELVGAESTNNSHASFVFATNDRVLSFDSPSFAESIENVVRQRAITHILPAHDDVQLALAQVSSNISAAVLSSPLKTLEITRIKSRTYSLLSSSVPVPRTWDAESISMNMLPYPVFVKPDRGQGSQNTHLCRDSRELENVLKFNKDMLVCEYLPGREATVDCFSDREKGLLLAEPRLRLRTRAGISVRTASVSIPQAREYAARISGQLSLFGAWFFQLRERAPDEWVLLEVGARLPGGATYQRLRGVNLPLLTIFEHERAPIEVLSYPWEPLVMDRAFVSRFEFSVAYEAIFVDFDDTLSIRGTPNLDLVGLLVAARHHGKRIVLLTRNSGSCHSWLEAHGLTDLFHDIVLIDKISPKHKFMHGRSILVDDSFSERRECFLAGKVCVESDAAMALTSQLIRKGG